MYKYHKRPVKFALFPKEHGMYSDYLTELSIDSEGTGEFVTIDQPMRTERGVSFEAEEWEALKLAVDEIFAEIKENEA